MANLPVREVFANALECPSERDRFDYLERACAGAPELRKRVEELLRAHQNAVGIIDKAAVELLASKPDPNRTADHEPESETPSDPNRTTPAESKRYLEQRAKSGRRSAEPEEQGRIGEVVGGYELTRKLGDGGMGTVYLGEKKDGNEVHRVAIKLIKPDRVNPHFLARFKAERRILTRLNHGNIAKVFDLGVHVVDSGEPGSIPHEEPYFIMEYVSGKDSSGLTLDGYCSANKLSIRDRLALFEAVCRGVEHAHSSGIIHRDLKGLNILVAVPRDGQPVPKVIDFGLAKALEGEEGIDEELTSPGVFMGTPAYASPEQAAGAVGIGPRTDVYALGVILYRLLTGVLPIDLAGVPPLKMLEKIGSDIPLLPSVKVAARPDILPKVAEERGIEPAKLPTLLRGDLDWVVKKTLEKDPQNRYATAGALADEIRRFLNGEPVEAGPDGRWHRTKKFARRNRALVTAGSVVIVTLVLGVVGLAIGLATVNAAKNNEIAAREQETLAKNDAIAARIDAEEAAEDRKKAMMISRATIRASIHSSEALDEEGKQRYRLILTGLRQIAVEKPGAQRKVRESNADTSFDIASLATLVSPDEAEGAYGDAIRKYESLNAEFPDTPEYMNELARCRFDRAHLHRGAGRTDQAVADLRAAIKLHKAVVALAPSEAAYRREVADAYNDLGVVFLEAERLKEADSELRIAVEQGEKAKALNEKQPSYHLDLAKGYHNLGNAIRDQGGLKESIEVYSKGIALLRPLAAGLPERGTNKKATQEVVITLWDRANARNQLKQYDDAFGDWDMAWRLDQQFKFQTGDLGKFRAAAELEKKHQGRIPPGESLQAAKVNAQAYKAAKDAGERSLREFYGKRVYGLLTEAKNAGWFRDEKNVAAFQADPDFAALAKESIPAGLPDPTSPKK
ncbi:MAG: protein kinase [Gemmataceae bacterium]